jgi:acetyl esterase/lipase
MSILTHTLGSFLLNGALLSFAVLAIAPCAAAQDVVAQTFDLWPEGAPGALGQEAKDKPQVIAYALPKGEKPHPAIVICPGGGYGGLAMDHEGHQIARWLNSMGVSAFICDYRHRGKGYGHPAPMQDVQRAIRTVRHQAEEWGVDPQKIGVLGFSAGGHLASTAATHFDKGLPEGDAVAKTSCRPDFAILCYPVIAFDAPFTHRGSQENLLGKNADPKLVAEMSNEKQVTSETPPTFLWHTTEDKAVPPENSIVFYQALVKAGVPAELHIYEKGRHGVGLGKNTGTPGAAEWTNACKIWLQTRGVLPESK